MSPYTLVLHGGAGTILKSQLSADMESRYTQALEKALQTGWDILHTGGSALDAVEKTVRELEDCPLFNAGRGAVFNARGEHEMDAAIMDGKDRRAGAVALLRNVRNPVSLARAIMEQSPHVFLAGEGAEEFARQQGIATEEPAYFHDEFRYRQWLELRDSDSVQLDHSRSEKASGPADQKFGTVGAAALDQHGNLAAATSTGGMTNKRFGRIGDSSLIGAGNYASNRSCAVSCTGSGEFFIRAVAAYDLSCLMEYRGMSLEEAAREVVHERLVAIGGDGGLIAVDALGNFALPFNTEGMYRAAQSSSGRRFTGIYGPE